MSEGRVYVAQQKEAVESTSTLISSNRFDEDVSINETYSEKKATPRGFSPWDLNRLQVWVMPLIGLGLIITTISVIAAMVSMLKNSASSMIIPGQGYSGTVDSGFSSQDLLDAFLNSSNTPSTPNMTIPPASSSEAEILPHNIQNNENQNMTSDLITSCGPSRASAIELGCLFDVMATAWVPPICYDAKAAADAVDTESTLASYRAAGVYRWYSDRAFTHPIDQSLVQTLEQNTAYTISRFHTAHCLYIMRLIFQAIRRVLNGEKDVYIQGWAVEDKHADHCSLLLANEDTPPISPVQVFFQISDCVRLDGNHDLVKELASRI